MPGRDSGFPQTSGDRDPATTALLLDGRRGKGKMNCRSVQNRLTALLDEELPKATAARIQAHLDTCQVCAQAWQEHLALHQLAAAWTVEGGEVWEAVRQEIE